MRRGLIAVLMSLTLCLSLGVMAGCSSSTNAEEFIRENLTAELDEIKNADAAVVESMVRGMESGLSRSDLAALEQMGVTGEGIAYSVLDGFDYTIDDIEVDGDEAVAQVTVKAKSLGDLTTKLEAVGDEIMADSASVENLSDEEVMKLFGEKMQNALDNIPLTESTVSLDFEKKGNTWSITNQSALALGSLFSS